LPVPLLIVDNHPATVEGLRHVLTSLGGFIVVATGRTSQDAIRLASEYPSAVMMMDLSVPGDTLGAVREISSKLSGIRVLVFTASGGVEHAVKALEAGARGYISKSSMMDEVAAGAKAVASGETYVSQDFGVGVITALRNASVRKIAAQALKLSAREDQIVALLVQGKTNKEIASHLRIAERTVKGYMTELMHKLKARNRVEAVIAAQNLTWSADTTLLPPHLVSRASPSKGQPDTTHYAVHPMLPAMRRLS